MSKSQTITINNTQFDIGPYGQGSIISLPVNTSGCFNLGNQFNLYISDNTGNFANETQIGTFSGIYTTFVNGTIPSSLAIGSGYQLRVKSTNPVVVSSPTSVSFQVLASATGVNAKVNPSIASQILSNQLYFGWCSNIKDNDSMELIDQSTSGATLSAQLENDYTGVITTPTFSNGQLNLTLGIAYYTLTVKAVVNGIASTNSYFLINSNNQLALATVGEQKGCLPDSLQFSIITDPNSSGIGSNFPSTMYSIDWGDGTTSIYRQCDLINSNGNVSHLYSSTSCSVTASSFNVTATLLNPFFVSGGSATLGQCEEPVVSTKARVFMKPVANFSVQPVGCVNTPITVTNNANPGLAQYGSGCTALANYFWYINNVLVYQSTSPEIPPNLTHTFTQPGVDSIKLVVDNGSCATSSYTDSICVIAAANPAYDIQGNTSYSGCAPVSFIPHNNTPSPYCSVWTYGWALFDSVGINPAPSTSYSISQPNAAEPTVNIDTPGKYKLRLCINSACGTNCVNENVLVVGAATVKFPSNVSYYCGANQVVDFSTSTSSKPTYNNVYGKTETFQWTIAGGAYTFVNGTNANSRYPAILFNDFATYTVTVTYGNECGNNVASQQIILNSPVTAFAGNDTTICYNVSSVPLRGSYTGPEQSIIWSTTGSGSFSNSSITNPTYTPSLADKTSGSISLIMKVVTPKPSACIDVSDTLVLSILPINNGKDSSLAICSGTTLNYKPVSSINGSTYTWVSNIISGTISGNSTSGSGNITDVLSNTSTSDAQVQYTITPTALGCTGESFNFIVTVHPVPQLTAIAVPSAICSYENTNISLSSNIAGITYSWIATPSTTLMTGYSNQTNQTGAAIQQNLVNGSTLNATVQYAIQSKSNYGCLSNTQTVTITVAPGATKANAGVDKNLCNTSSSNLTGNTNIVGVGTWTQVNGSAVTIVDPNNPTSLVTGLIPGSYSFAWTIQSTVAGCPSTSDTTVWNIYPASVGGTAISDTTVCGENNSGIIRLSGYVGTIIRWEASVDNGSTWQAIANITDSLVYTNMAVTTLFRTVVQSSICSSVNSNTVTITVIPATSQANAGSDQSLCNQTSTTLSANTPVSGTGVWLQIEGPLATISNPSVVNPTVSGLILDSSYQFEWKINNSVCPSTADTMIIKTYSPLTSSIDPTTYNICEGQTVIVAGVNPTGGTSLYNYQWQESTDNVMWTNIANNVSFNLTIIPSSTIYVRRVVVSGPCTLASNSVLISVQPSVKNNTIGSNQNVCINTSATTLTGSLPTGGNSIYAYQWQSSTDGVTWADIINATNQSYAPGVLTQTTYYRRTVATDLCYGAQVSISDTVTLTVIPDTKAQLNVVSTIGCAPFVINATVVQAQTFAGNGSYQWFANGNYIGTNTSIPAYTITNPGDSVLIKLKTISSYGCKSDSAKQMFYTYYKPAPSFTLSQTVSCSALPVTMINTTPNANEFSYQWNFGNGQTSTLQNPPSVTFYPNPNGNDTVYTISLSAYTICEADTVSQTVRIKSKPHSLFTPDKTIGCSPLTVNFSNVSFGQNMQFTWDFGDGTTLSSSVVQSVQHTYHTGVQDTFHVKLYASNDCGIDSSVYNIIVSPNTIIPAFGVNGTEATGCAPHLVHFINHSYGATFFMWNFGDGNLLTTTKNIDTVVHTYTAAGTYTVSLEATNGCSDSTTYFTVNVFASPVADFNTIPSTTCIGDSISFTNLTNAANSYQWNFGDNNTSLLTNPLYAYKSAGTFNVQLIATRIYQPLGNTCSDTVNKSVVITAQKTGAFNVSSSSGTCVPLVETFTNQSLPSTLTTWNFGDGQTGTSDIVTHTYGSPGTYTINMVATTSGGCAYVASQNIVITAPSGTWTYDHGFICNATSVHFEATVQNTDSLQWNFGDGTTETTTSGIIYHSYQQAGKYLPIVYLKTKAGCVVPLPGIDTIYVDYIKAGFKYVQQNLCGSTDITFTDTSRAYYGLSQWEWNFGDATTSTLQNPPSHTYTLSNTWNIQLVAISNSGCTDTAKLSLNVHVNSVPVISSIQSNSTGCTNQPISYVAYIASIDPITNYNWAFSAGGSDKGQSVTYYYSSPGTYTATLTALTSNGCSTSATSSQIVIGLTPPVTVGQRTPTPICLGNKLPLTVVGADSYSWTPLNSNLSCYTCANPVASPLTSTTYYVTGTTNNCSAQDTVTVTVIQPTHLVVPSSLEMCIGQTKEIVASGAANYKWSSYPTITPTNTSTVTVDPTATTVYQVIGYDSYNCFSDTAYVTVNVGAYPTVNLGRDTVYLAGSNITLSPTVTNGPISTWFWSPSTGLSCSDCATPVATITNNVCYSVTATNEYGCSGSDSICIRSFCENSEVFIPDAFTPDGDGINDILMVRASGIKLVKRFIIFNRWGQVVFEKTNFPPNEPSYGWDGRMKGTNTMASTDVYVYMCDVVCDNGVAFSYKGNVAILK